MSIVYHERDGLTDTERVDKPCRPVLVHLGTREAQPQRGSGPQPVAAVAGTKNLSTDTEHPLAVERPWALYD